MLMLSVLTGDEVPTRAVTRMKAVYAYIQRMLPIQARSAEGTSRDESLTYSEADVGLCRDSRSSREVTNGSRNTSSLSMLDEACNAQLPRLGIRTNLFVGHYVCFGNLGSSQVPVTYVGIHRHGRHLHGRTRAA